MAEKNQSQRKTRTHIPVQGYSIDELRIKGLDELLKLANNLGIENPQELKRQDLIFEILKSQTS